MTTHRSPPPQPGTPSTNGHVHDLVSGTDAPTAPLWRRALARLTDIGSVLFLLWLLVIMQVLWFMGEASRRFDPEPWGQAFVPLCLFIVLSAVYEVVFIRRNNGQTPGKQFFGVRVAHHADGTNVSTTRAIARWAIPGLVFVVWPLWAGLALLALTAVSVPFGRHRRAIHDHLAGTVVVRYEHVDDEVDEPDDHPDESDPSGLDTSWTITDVLFGRPSRRAVRRRKPFRADQEVDHD